MQNERQKRDMSLNKFGGINIIDSRESIGDNEFSWLENLIPTSDNNLYQTPANSTIKVQISNDPTESIQFSHISNLIMPLTGTQTQPTIVPIMLAVSSKGILYSVNLTTNAVSIIPGSYLPESFSAAPWNSSVILASDISNRLFVVTPIGYSFSGGVGNIVMNSPGSGYTSAPAVIATGGGGSGLTANAYINSSGNITGVVIVNGGSGYTSAPTISFLGGGGSGATATAYINSGTSGQAVAVYAGRAWIAKNRSIFYSDTNLFTNFSGGSSGSFNIYDESLNGNITALFVANNYLYIFGGSSIDIIGDVSISGSGSLLFTRTNITASVGSSFPQSIFTIGSTLYFASNNGIYAMNGVTTKKISRKIDPLYYTSVNNSFTSKVNGISGAQVSINGSIYAVFNVGIIDTFSGLYTVPTNRYISILYLDDKWATCTLSNDVSIGTPQLSSYALINSIPSIYVFYGMKVYVAFSDNSTVIDGIIRTKLYNANNAIVNKQLMKTGIVGHFISGSSNPITIDAESENGSVNVLSSSFIAPGFRFIFSNVRSLLGKYFGLNIRTKFSAQDNDGKATVISEIVVEYEEGARW